MEESGKYRETAEFSRASLIEQCIVNVSVKPYSLHVPVRPAQSEQRLIKGHQND